MSTQITYFGKTNFRNESKVFGIRQSDRLLHTYMVGKTGTGKSTLLKSMFLQDVKAFTGACILDPHGDLVSDLYNSIPEGRRKDVLYFNFTDPLLELRYNPFKKVSKGKMSLVASGIIEVFKKLWHDAWGVKLEHLLRNAILSLLEAPEANIGDIPRIFLDSSFRREIIKHVTNPFVRNFWAKEFPNYNRYDLLPVLNKVGGMLSHPVIRNALITNRQEVSLRKAMDDGKIVLVNISKGILGEDASHILGALFISSLSSAAFSRADTKEEDRIPYMLYLDEFHNFTTLSLVNMFAEMRKFGLGLTLAHQYLFQLDDEIKQAIFGNVGTIISFRIGAEDARFMAKEMYPIFEIDDFINLPNRSIYLKLMIDGKPSKPFSAVTIMS